MSAARVTVLMPCYNDGAFVEEAVASVREREPVEIVLVDDASDDASTEAALERLEGRPGLTILRHDRNRGVAAARNTGLAAVATRYLFTLDSDDVAMEGALAKLADRLDAADAPAVAFGDYQEIGGQGDLRRMPARLDPFRIAYINEYPTSALFRTDVVRDVGGWRDRGRLEGYEDWDLWMTLAERGLRGVHVGRGTVVWGYRQHEGRLLAETRRQHAFVYDQLRVLHPDLYGSLARHRRDSNLGLVYKALFPAVYGRRPLFKEHAPVKQLLSRTALMRRLR
jgi:glycosyltransferase involved in cell wall biosynthesis